MLERNKVTLSGASAGAPMIFIHGFGCDQSMWSQVAGQFKAHHPIVTYDLTGMGQSDLSAYDPSRYADLRAHADDLVAIIEQLQLEDAVLVGHSVGATIALLAARQAPGRVRQVVLVSPSPCFMEDAARDYHGGFSREDLEGLITFLDENHLGWSAQMAPTIAGQPQGAAATEDLTQSFCRTDPAIAQHFGRVTFLGDERQTFEQARSPALILHCNKDALVPMAVADWMMDRMPDATLQVLDATGHCHHMTVPIEVAAAMRGYLDRG